VKIGDKVWYFDETRRVYRNDKGGITAGPLYRGKFVEKFIVGETRQSWILGYDMDTKLDNGFKILKRNASRLIFDTEDAVNKVCWVESNRYKISDLVNKCNDYDKLQRIVKILEGN